MIENQTTLLAVLCIWISGLLFGLVVMGTVPSKRHKKELEYWKKRVRQYEELRRTQADTIRRVGLKYTNLKHGITKLMKRYKGLANESSFGKALREVIDE